MTELQELGKPTTNLKLAGGYAWLIPSTDPEKTWHEAADHIIYQLNGYAEWSEKAGIPLIPHVRDKAHLRELGIFNVVDVDTCTKMIGDYASEVPLTHFYSWTSAVRIASKLDPIVLGTIRQQGDPNIALIECVMMALLPASSRLRTPAEGVESAAGSSPRHHRRSAPRDGYDSS